MVSINLPYLIPINTIYLPCESALGWGLALKVGLKIQGFVLAHASLPLLLLLLFLLFLEI